MSDNYGTLIKGFILLIAISVSQISYASTDAQRFNERFIELLPPGDTLKMMEAAKDKGNLGKEGGYYDFGKGVCIALSEGKDKKNILEENYYQFFGKDLSDIIYKAALDTLCPQYKK